MTSAVSSGVRLGPYEIVSRIGAGGMGEVWKAIDTRLERNVAIKVLPVELAADAQFKGRFEREAKTISQLHHQHICVLHDVGEATPSQASGDSLPAGVPVSYLVMELLEGETLAARLERGPLPLDQVLRIGAQIADALDTAHRSGVIHRDLKPANVMMTKSGAKLLDFGLARSISIAPWGTESSATMVRDGGEGSGATSVRKGLTAEGTIVGTFQYMAPEQLEGTPADARTDIFALGSLLYEMATGRRAFDGATKTSIIAAIVDRDPLPMRQLQPLTPPGLEHVVARCLAKSPDDRWQSAHDIAHELSWIREAGSQAGVAAPVIARKRSRERMAWAAAAVLAISTLALLAVLLPKLRPARPFVADMAPPRGTRFNAVGDEGGPLVLSPDGTMAVYSAADKSGTRLMLRSLVTGENKVLDKTEGAMFPFWSPDSRKVGFFTTTALQRLDISGGAPVTIAAVPAGRGGAWGANDIIVFAANTQGPLSKVSASGGAAVDVSKLDTSIHTSHRWASFLPDGKRFLFLACNHEDPSGSVNAIYLGSVDGGEQKMILRSVSNAIYADGYLLYDRDQTLYAQKVKDDFSLVGEPVAIAQDVLYDAGVWRGSFSVSQQGLLSYHSGQASVISNLVWVDRHGAVIEMVGERDQFWDVVLSPNRQKVLLPIGDPQRDLWVQDLQRKVRTKITLAGWVNAPAWAPDGESVYVDMLRRGGWELVEKRLAGGERVLARKKTAFVPTSVSPDGKWLFTQDESGSVERRSLATPDKAELLAKTGSLASAAVVSPDGRWLAYGSNENGRNEVFALSLARPDVKWQVSSNGGNFPRWRPDGREIFFIDLAGHMMAAPVSTSGDSVDFGPPQALFSLNLRPNTATSYDISADGERILVNVLADEESPTVKLVSDWKARLPK